MHEAHACNPSYLEDRLRESLLQANLGKKKKKKFMRTCLNRKKLGMVGHLTSQLWWEA
jgi:hypothetical protein